MVQIFFMQPGSKFQTNHLEFIYVKFEVPSSLLVLRSCLAKPARLVFNCSLPVLIPEEANTFELLVIDQDDGCAKKTTCVSN